MINRCIVTLCGAILVFCLAAQPLGAQEPPINATEQPVASNEEIFPYSLTIQDDADLLSEEQEKELSALMQPITAYENIAFLSVSSSPDSVETTAENFARSTFADQPGSVLVIDMGHRKIRVFTIGSTEDALSNDIAESIVANTYSLASDGNYYGCAAEVFQEINAILEGSTIAQPMKHASNALLALLIALIGNYALMALCNSNVKANDKELLSSLKHKSKFLEGQPVLVSTTTVYSPQDDSSDSGGGGGGSGASHDF